MKIKTFIVINLLVPWGIWGNSITISPDTLFSTIEAGELNALAVTITNHNSSTINLGIFILEQPAAGRILFDAPRFAPVPESLLRNFSPDIRYQDEQGAWVNGIRCGTAPTPDAILDHVRQELHIRRSHHNGQRNLVNIQVAWHVIHAESGAGNISDQMIIDQINVLNDAYAPFDIFFTLEIIDRTANTDWYNDMDQYESQYKQALYVDPIHYMNVYTGNMPGLLGWSYLPFQWPENSYMHGVCLLYSSLPGGSSYPYNAGDTATHEVGHYAGLEHTFLNGCSASNDYVDDTPQEDDGDNIYNCNNTDTCPNDSGVDPIHNFMTYTDDACLDEFTAGQGERIDDMISTYRPGLLENPVAPNWIYPAVDTITIPANSTADMALIFDGSSLAGGDYLANIYFEETTMDTMVVLPAYLHVTGILNLDMSFETVRDTLYPNEFINYYLEMIFNGENILTYVFDHDISWLTVLGANGELENGESDFITFNLSSLFMSPGDYEGEVILNSNQGSTPILLYLTVQEELGLIDDLLPKKFAVTNNYPNPFNPVTTFSIDLPEQLFVTVAVYDLNGRKIATLLNSVLNAGSSTISWKGQDDSGVMVSAGVYFLMVDAQQNHHVQKMIFMK